MGGGTHGVRSVPGRKLLRALLISGLVALLAPIVLGGMLAATNALAATGGTESSTTTPRDVHVPKPPPPARRTLSSLGRASAVAWIRVGHVGR